MPDRSECDQIAEQSMQRSGKRKTSGAWIPEYREDPQDKVEKFSASGLQTSGILLKNLERVRSEGKPGGVGKHHETRGVEKGEQGEVRSGKRTVRG